MVLRWHYAVDVAGGLTLAIFAATVAPKIAHAEAMYRRRHRMRAVWRFADRSDRPEPALSDGARR
jgi:membrane-associated phospholipid phosphatase